MENNFNPTQYGAVPVGNTGGSSDGTFDPLKYATKVDTSIAPMKPDQSATTAGHANGMLSKLIGGVGHFATEAAPTIGAIGGGVLGAAGGALVGGPVGAYAGGVAGAGLGASTGEAIKEHVQGQNLDASKIAKEGVVNSAFDAVGGPLLNVGGKILVSSARPLVAGAGRLLEKGSEATGATVPRVVTDFLAKRAEKKAVDQSIDAVYSSPTGKKFTQASNQVVTGDRQITPASIFREQGLTPDQQTVNLGTRLKDLGLGKDSVKNTDIIAKGMEDTEARLQTELSAHPEITANKPVLVSTLDAIKTGAPQEFRIRDSQAMINRAVDFAKKVISTSDDSIKGVRTARTAFDSQAKREFPTAFKPDGSIDIKTPAGYAIQTARDAINEHLYNTAPNGSEIQALVGREADLYRAGRIAMEKASSGQGKKAFQKWVEENPKKSALIGGIGTMAGYGELKKVPLVGDLLPG